jgi:hypothetical protein
VQHGLSARIGTEPDVIAQVVDRLLITLLGLQGERLLTDVIAAENRLEFFQRLCTEPFEIPHLCEGILHEVGEGFVQCRHRGRGFELEGLAGSVVIGLG